VRATAGVGQGKGMADEMPELGGVTEWINSAPLDREGLRGRVVVVNFWTLTCINWLRQAPYVKAWARAYREDGLVVIGAHTPEFSFEHEIPGIRQAVTTREVDYPVAVDNEYAVWTAFDNHFWPALYFVDRNGIIRDAHFGEGRYEESERVIQGLLGVDRTPVVVEGQGVEAPADWNHLRTPETYLGSDRGERGPAAHGHSFEFPDYLGFNRWALDGEWTIGREEVTVDRACGRIAFAYQARDANVVLASGPGGPIPFQVLLDGKAPGPSHGVDVDEEGNGVLREGRMYQLIREHDDVRERTVEIFFTEAGARAYSFTFG
jgi:thiol-disulfide isomerase/thioredoxin